MENKKSITKNYIYNLSYQIMVMILPIITTPYISRVLGAEKIGIYSYTVSITTFFILFGSLGIGLYGQREIAFCQDDKKKYSQIFWEILILKCIAMTISMGIYYFAFVTDGIYQIYYKILILELLGNILDISWFFQGLEEFRKIALRNILIKIISVSCIFIFVKTQDDLIKYFLIYALSVLLGNVSLWLYLPKYLKKIKLSQLNVYKHLKPTISLFIPQIAIQIYIVLDKTMIGTIITDKSETGFYDQAQKVVKILLTLVTALTTVMFPRIASSFVKKDFEAIKNYMYRSFDFILLMSLPIIAGICACADIFVIKFFGEGYEKVIVLMKIISPIILFIGLSSVIGHQYLLPTKKQKQYTISVTLGAIINFCCNMLLIPKYGAIGASIGTVIAELSVTLCQCIYVRKELKFLKIFRSFVKYSGYAIIMYIVCKALSFIPLKDTYVLLIQMIGGIITYGLLLIIFKDNLFIELRNKVFSIFKRKNSLL